MTSNGIVDIGLGLALVYMLISVLSSGVLEWLAQKSSRRGECLRKGLMQLLMDRWIYLHVINHPLVACMYRDNPGKRARPPAYVPSGVFAHALVDVVMKKGQRLGANISSTPGRAPSFSELHAAVAVCANAGLGIGTALLPLVSSAGYDVDAARKNIERWYESMMERVSGWYKRETRPYLFWVGLLAAIAFNVDSIQITQRLFESEEVRTRIAGAARTLVDSKEVLGKKEVVASQSVPDAEQHMRNLKEFADHVKKLHDDGLPVGYRCLNGDATASKQWVGKLDSSNPCASDLAAFWQDRGKVVLTFLGWLITALAVSLGAPFWFDILNKLADVRGAGRKPENNSLAGAT